MCVKADGSVGGGMLGCDYYCACVRVDQVYSVYTGQSNCGNYINQPMVTVQIRPTIYAALNLFGKSTHTMVLTYFVKVSYKYLK